MGVYGVTARSYRRHNNSNRLQVQHHHKRQTSIPAHYIRLKERIARSSANYSHSNSISNNLFGPHLIISPKDRLTLQKSNSFATRPKATITMSTADAYRIRPFLFSARSSASATTTRAVLRHTKSGPICKSIHSAPRSTFNRVYTQPSIGASVVQRDHHQQQQQQHVQLSQQRLQGVGGYTHQAQPQPQSLTTAASLLSIVDGDNSTMMMDGDNDDETEDVEIDIDGVGRSGYNHHHSNLATTTSNSAPTTTTPVHIHTTFPGAATTGQSQFGHEEIEFGTRSGSSASATTTTTTAVFGSESVSSPSASSTVSRTSSSSSSSSTVCSGSTTSTLVTPIEQDSSTGYHYHQEQEQDLLPNHELVKLKREAFQELASQTQRFDDIFIAKMIHWESLSPQEKTQWLERGHEHHVEDSQNDHNPQREPREQEMDDLVNALECRATVKDYSALIAFERQAELQRRSLMEQY
ncbi:hypothetical protein BGX23_004200 [Mortierella sp. AD031]|nr:hypothetical protein BGX23_004200 [Mortierella sp. AD031]